ncbi:Serine/threonine protein kinase PrkC, regulator of stationary phase [Fimbriiglobus ruber]|uniref:Serine/threonine protein kinase PrkC, regulator of stationary phase n=1 Tax=Fimbriiglobus ruber TaxID=1908690 RepID=A0A225DGU0_9BACT|nr:Serine/threonine protein kinase PrkC, regulator of stationary phase [Fimbriiglobus ruber]
MPELTAAAESLIARFEAAWIGGRRPDLIGTLDDCPPDERGVVIRELIHADLEFRLKSGDDAVAGEYLSRFPELAADVVFVKELADAEGRHRRQRDSQSTPVSFGTESSPADRTRALPAPGPPTSPSPFLRPPEGPDEIGRLGGYRVVGQLGAGGMGVVYRAIDPQLNRAVALKVMRPEWAADPAARARFLREAESQAAVENDHIVPIYQIGDDTGVPFLAMPLLRGEALEQRLRSGQAIPLPTAVRIACHVAEGLAAAHTVGLIHRDIKPSNVWLETTSEGAFRRARLLDFGLARRGIGSADLTGSGVAVGTPAYMAPEQARGEAGPRSDLFGLGCVLYQMATGRRPFTGPDVMATLTAIAVEIPPPARSLNPAVPEALSALIDRLLSKNPAARPGSAAEVSADLSRWSASGQSREVVDETMAGTSAATERDPVRAIPAKTSTGSEAATISPQATVARRNWWWWAITVAAVLALFGSVIAFSGTIVRVVTNKGDLVIEVDDPNVEVVVKQGGVVVEDRTTKRSFVLRAGDGEVEFRDSDSGAVAQTKTFRIERAGRAVVTAAMGIKDAVPGRPYDQIAERQVVEWALRSGIAVWINTPGRIDNIQIKTVSELPSGFRVRELEAMRNPTLHDGELIHHLEKLSALDQLRLVHCDALSLRFLPSLVGLPLTHLKLLETCTEMGDEGVRHLTRLNRLTTLVLTPKTMTVVGLMDLCRLPELRCLWLTKAAVVDPWFGHLASAPLLEKVILGHIPIEISARWTRDGLAALGRSPTIKAVHIYESVYPTHALSGLAAAPGLANLELAETTIGDAICPHIARLPALTSLRLDRNRVTDEGVKQIATLKTLKTLDLSKTEITDAAVPLLAALDGLTFLKVVDTRITPAGLLALNKALPGCQILPPPPELGGGRVPPPSPHPFDQAAERRAAEWVLSVARPGEWAGLAVSLPGSNADLSIGKASDLPPEFQVRSVTFHGCSKVTDEAVVARLAGLSKLRCVIFADCLNVADAGVRTVAANPGLESVVVQSCGPVTAAGMIALAANPSIRTLAVRSTSVSADGLRAIGRMADLETLSFEMYRGDPDGLAALARLTKLKHLTLTFSSVSDTGLKSLRGLTELETLKLDATQVGDEGMEHLAGLMNLRTLTLEETKVGDRGLAKLRGLTRLESLSLRGTRFTGTEMASLKTLPRLRALNLLDCEDLAPDGFGVIARLPHLESVRIRGRAVTSEAIRMLAGSKTLTSLEWHGPTVTPAALKELAGLAALRRLGLSNSGVTDEAVPALSKLTRLEFLDLNETKVTPAGLRQLRQTLPKCEIVPKSALSLLEFDQAAERRAAEWVLAHNGWVRYQVATGNRGEARKPEEFPDKPFIITDIVLTNDAKFATQDLDILRDCSGVKDLVLNSPSLTDAGWAKIGTFPGFAGLRYLGLNGTAITAAGFATFPAFPHLEGIEIFWGTAITPEAAAQLRKLPRLRYFKPCGRECRPGVVAILAQLPIEDLNLGDCGLRTVAEVESVAQSKTIKSLNLGNAELGDDHLAALKPLKSLRALAISRAAITGKGLAHLADLPRLEALALEYTLVGNDHLVAVAKLPALRILNLMRTGLTDAAVPHLSKLINLTKLELDDTKISAAGLRTLKTVLPNCQITPEPPKGVR